MSAYIRCEFCGQVRNNGQECFTYGDAKDCTFLRNVACSAKGGCQHGKGDPPMDCAFPDCAELSPEPTPTPGKE